MASVGLGSGEEHGESCTGDECSRPRCLGNVLVDPEPAQDEGEDQFGDEDRLTIESGPLWSATAWKANAPVAATQPRSHKGWRIRKETSFQPRSLSVAPALATCWVMRGTAFARAAARAKMIVKVTSPRPD